MKGKSEEQGRFVRAIRTAKKQQSKAFTFVTKDGEHEQYALAEDRRYYLVKA